jgi:CRISPR-associated exonuclease Cas4
VVALTTLLALGLVGAGALVLLGALRVLRRAAAEARYGSLMAVDDGPGAGPLLRSERYRLVGRPDEVRRLPDGRFVPVEFKSRPAPNSGVPRSHRVQVAAYALLLEEASGRSPPYGVVRYGDGREFQVPWDRAARAELLQIREEMLRPYDGRATPTVARCARCPWRDVCDVRAG